MKKIFSFILITITVVLFVSCNKANSFEREAKEQMNKTMKEFAKNPDTFAITEVETKFSDDSTCVLHFVGKGQNGFGGWNTNRYEYVYVKSKDEDNNTYNTYETIIDLDDREESVYERAKDMYESFLTYRFSKELHESDVDNKDNNIQTEKTDEETAKQMKCVGWENETKECRAGFIHSASLLTATLRGRKVNGDKEKESWE